MTEQTSLFSPPKPFDFRAADEAAIRSTKLEQKYKDWRETDHGIEVFKMCERFALEAAARNRRFGIGLIAERVRWESFISGRDEEGYKINNNHKPYIARELIEQYPRLSELITLRETKGY